MLPNALSLPALSVSKGRRAGEGCLWRKFQIKKSDQRMHNTEDKHWWVIEWAKQEQLFVAQVCPALGLIATINPAKQHDRYAPDIVVDGQIADLKCQQTPFFKAQVLYKLDPQYVVTFNRKDYLRYQRLYPIITIYFWLDWQVRDMLIGRSTFAVQPLAGVWRAPFAQLAELIETTKAPLHTYQRRQADLQGNAKASYLVDVRTLECLYRRL